MDNIGVSFTNFTIPDGGDQPHQVPGAIPEPVTAAFGLISLAGLALAASGRRTA